MTHLTCRDCPECEGKGEVYREFVSVPAYPGGWGVYECERCGGEGVVTDELVGEEKGMHVEKGTQIAYIPTHAGGDIDHKDVEFGFVTSVKPELDIAYCRYWSKYSPGELRTKANSEGTPLNCLVEHIFVEQAVVDRLATELGYE